jgi:hypothetical protein
MATEDPKRSGAGKPPTRLLEPPAKAPEKQEPREESPEVDEGVVETLDQQEKPDDEKDSMLNELGRNPKPDPKKVPEPEKKDSSSDDAGDCACP